MPVDPGRRENRPLSDISLNEIYGPSRSFDEFLRRLTQLAQREGISPGSRPAQRPLPPGYESTPTGIGKISGRRYNENDPIPPGFEVDPDRTREFGHRVLRLIGSTPERGPSSVSIPFPLRPITPSRNNPVNPDDYSDEDPLPSGGFPSSRRYNPPPGHIRPDVPPQPIPREGGETRSPTSADALERRIIDMQRRNESNEYTGRDLPNMGPPEYGEFPIPWGMEDPGTGTPMFHFPPSMGGAAGGYQARPGPLGQTEPFPPQASMRIGQNNSSYDDALRRRLLDMEQRNASLYPHMGDEEGNIELGPYEIPRVIGAPLGEELREPPTSSVPPGLTAFPYHPQGAGGHWPYITGLYPWQHGRPTEEEARGIIEGTGTEPYPTPGGRDIGQNNSSIVDDLLGGLVGGGFTPAPVFGIPGFTPAPQGPSVNTSSLDPRLAAILRRMERIQ